MLSGDSKEGVPVTKEETAYETGMVSFVYGESAPAYERTEGVLVFCRRAGVEEVLVLR